MFTAGDSYSGEIESADDSDYIRIEVPNFYTDLKFESIGNLDIDGTLYDANCRFVTSNYDIDYPNNTNFGIIRNLRPSIYYLRIHPYNYPAPQIGPYSVRVTLNKNFVYLSAKYGANAEVELGTTTDTPYSPEYPEPAYFENHGNHSNSRVYDSVAESYYQTVDPYGRRATLDDWKFVNGFTNYLGESSADIIYAEYVNAYDLALGRKMSCRNVAPAFPCVVENYYVGESLQEEPELFAYVAMERVDNEVHTGLTREKDDRYYTAFYAYDKFGNRVNSVDLDGSGAKRVPEVCWSCHEGRRRDTPYYSGGGEGSTDGQYLPFDTELFHRFPGSNLSISQQQDNFRRLNRVISSIFSQDLTKPTFAHGPRNRVHGEIAKLIQHWEINGASSDFPEAFRKSMSVLISGGFQSHPGNDIGHFSASTKDRTIRDFYNRYCRTCHVAQPSTQTSSSSMNCTVCHGEGPTSSLNKYPKCGSCHTARPATLPNLNRVLCDSTTPEAEHMPNAKIMHKRFIDENTHFWDSSIIPHPLNPDLLGRLHRSLSSASLCTSGFATELFPKNDN